MLAKCSGGNLFRLQTPLSQRGWSAVLKGQFSLQDRQNAKLRHFSRKEGGVNEEWNILERLLSTKITGIFFFN